MCTQESLFDHVKSDDGAVLAIDNGVESEKTHLPVRQVFISSYLLSDLFEMYCRNESA